jgi:hypothetical protein
MDINDLLNKYDIKYPICGAYCDKGRLPIVEQLIVSLINLGWDKDLHQVKKKFGGLRFYIGNTTQEMSVLIVKAESLSFKTCEECGKPAKTDTVNNWHMTLCKPCKENYLQEIR